MSVIHQTYYDFNKNYKILRKISNYTCYCSKNNCLIDISEKNLIVGCVSSIIPDDGNVIHIDDYAFAGCDNLTNIIIPNTITSIGEGSFSGCEDLQMIMIPDRETCSWGIEKTKQNTLLNTSTIAASSF